MAITVNFNGASIRKPGSYSKTSVNLVGGFPLAPTGVVGIIGESAAGEPGTAGVKTFTSEDMAALIAEYVSGPIVDAARLLTSPARDNRVANGASYIRVFKTNASTKATRTLDNAGADDLMVISSVNFGENESRISVKVDAGTSANQVILTVARGTVSETLAENKAEVQLSVQYTGSDAACTATIQAVAGVKTLKLTTGSTPADDLVISLANKSIQDVVDLIDDSAVFTAVSTLKSKTYKPAVELDSISTPLDVKTAVTPLLAVQKELLDIVNSQSSLVTAALVADAEGVPAVVSRRFLQGGVRGSSSNASFQAGFDAMLALRCNTVIPLVSRDATSLTVEGATDPASSWTVNAVNLQAVTHCITASNTKNRSERNTYVSVKGTFADAQTAAEDLSSERASMCFQDVKVLTASGDLEDREPWAAACMIAGIQAGTPVGTPATFKQVNALGISHTDYNQKTQIDLAIDAGLIPLETLDAGGIRCVVHNTTYGRDANFVFNRASVVEAADHVAFNMRTQLESIFIGTKVTSSLAADVRSTVTNLMSTFLNAGIIVGDDTNGSLGFKDLVVTVNGNVAVVDITITPVQGVDFVLNRIVLDTISQQS